MDASPLVRLLPSPNVSVLPVGSTPVAILTRLHEITTDLIESAGALALLSNAREEGRASSYATFRPDMNASGKDSVTARVRHSEFAVISIDTEIITLKAEITALQTEYQFLTLLLDHTQEV